MKHYGFCSGVRLDLSLPKSGLAEFRKSRYNAHGYYHNVTDPDSTEGYDFETKSGVKYTAHSMMHKGILDMEPTKLEMLDGFEETETGYKFTPPESNVRVMVTGRDWSRKRLLIYGGNSTEEAEEYVNEIIERVQQIGHQVEQVGELEVSNIAVNGDFGEPIYLENVMSNIRSAGIEVEFEPEQFPGLIINFDDLNITFLLFSTGKFSIQGLKDFEEIESSISRMSEYLP